jgi:hypothetical protein
MVRFIHAKSGRRRGLVESLIPVQSDRPLRRIRNL